MKILVVGAGIGGLTFAIAARRRGHEVTVVERRADFPEEGAGIVLGPNVMAALRPLGLADAILAVSQPIEEMRVTDAKGCVLASTRYSTSALPVPGQAIHRSLLHATLRESFEGELRLGQEVRKVDTSSNPTVWFGEETLRADLVVGSDGIRSRIREHLNPGFTPRYSGTTCWRFVVDRQWTTQATEMWGVGKRVGVVPLGQGKSYVFLTRNAARRERSPFKNLSEFRSHWAEFEHPAKAALEGLDDLSKVLHNDLEDGIPERWHAPGVVLLGDAAHAVTPNLGQGAGLAVEDACCLASLLDEPNVLARYESLRRPRATWILNRSYSVGKVAQLSSPWLCRLRDKVVAWTPDSANAAALRRLIHDMPGVPLG